MTFLITRNVVNPAGRAFEVNGTRPKTLSAGDLVEYKDNPSDLDLDWLKTCRAFIVEPTEANIERVAAEVAAEEKYWSDRTDSDGLVGFRSKPAKRK